MADPENAGRGIRMNHAQPTIGQAASIETALHELTAKLNSVTAVELLTVVGYRADDGTIQYAVNHTPLRSRFALIGVLHWVQNLLTEAPEK